MALEDDYRMPAADFVRWLEVMGFNHFRAARALGVNSATIAIYRQDGAPLIIALACANLARGDKPETALRRGPLPF